MRGIRFLTRSVALVSLFATVSTARPGIRHIDHGLLYGRSPQEITAIEDQSKNLAPLSNSIHTPSKRMMHSKRMMPGFTPAARRGTMNFSGFKKFQAIVPVEQAAFFLHEFYSRVASSAAGAWAQLPEKQYFTITEGNFELKFIAIGQHVAWDVVQEMAETMKNLAITGFTNLFEATFFDTTGKIGLKVALTLIDSSLSSEGDDFREGSVPSVSGPDNSYQLEHPGTRRRK